MAWSHLFFNANRVLISPFLVIFFCLTTSLSSESTLCESLPEEKSSSEKIKVLVLIIACDKNSSYPHAHENDPVYLGLQNVWKQYMNTDPRVEAYFLKSDPTIEEEYLIEGHTIWWKGEETWTPGILNKTLVALEAMTPRLHEFAYVYRTNLSSFIVFSRLLQFLESLPRNNCYCGTPYTEYDYTFVQGAGIILSSDLAHKLLNHKHQLFNSHIIDDVAIGFFLRDCGCEILLAPPRCDIVSLDQWKRCKGDISDDTFHIRAKNETGRRVPDEIIVQKELLQLFYGLTVKE